MTLSDSALTASLLIPKKLTQYTSSVYIPPNRHNWPDSSENDSDAPHDISNLPLQFLPACLFILPNPNISLSNILTDIIKIERQRLKELKFMKSSSASNYKAELARFKEVYGSVKKWSLVIYIVEELQDEFTSLICILFWILLEKLQRRAIVHHQSHFEEWTLDDKFAEIWTQIILKIPTEGRNASFSSFLSYSDLIHFLGLVLFRLFMFVFPEDSLQFHEELTRRWTLSECNYFIFGRENQEHLHVREGSRIVGGSRPTSGRSFQSASSAGGSSGLPSSRVHTGRSSFRGSQPSTRRNSAISSARSGKSTKEKKKIPFVPQHSLFLMPSDHMFSQHAEYRLESQKTIQEESEKAAQQNGAVKMTLKSLRMAEDSERLRKKMVLKRLETENKDLLSFNALDGLMEEMDSVDKALVAGAGVSEQTKAGTGAGDGVEESAPHSARTAVSTSSAAMRKSPLKSPQQNKPTESTIKRGQVWLDDQMVKKEWYEQGKGGMFKLKKPKPTNPKGFYTSATDYRTGPLVKRYLRTLHQEQRDVALKESKEKQLGAIATPSSPTPSEFNQTMQVPSGDSFFITNQQDWNDDGEDAVSGFVDDSGDQQQQSYVDADDGEYEEEYYSSFSDEPANTNDLLRTLEEDDGYVDSFEETHHSGQIRGYILE